MGVVKADAYGHGALPVARTLVAAGIERLAVALLEEAVELRRGGLTIPLLVMGALEPAQMGWNGAGRPAQVLVRSFVEQDLSVRNRLDEPSSEDWRWNPKNDVGVATLTHLRVSSWQKVRF